MAGTSKNFGSYGTFPAVGRKKSPKPLTLAQQERIKVVDEAPLQPLSFYEKWRKLGRRFTYTLAIPGFVLGSVLLGIFLYLQGKFGAAPAQFLGLATHYVAPILLPMGIILVSLATIGHLLHIALQGTAVHHKWQNTSKAARRLSGFLLFASVLSVLIGSYFPDWPVMQEFFARSVGTTHVASLFVSAGLAIGVMVFILHALHIAVQTSQHHRQKGGYSQAVEDLIDPDQEAAPVVQVNARNTKRMEQPLVVDGLPGVAASVVGTDDEVEEPTEDSDEDLAAAAANQLRMEAAKQQAALLAKAIAARQQPVLVPVEFKQPVGAAVNATSAGSPAMPTASSPASARGPRRAAPNLPIVAAANVVAETQDESSPAIARQLIAFFETGAIDHPSFTAAFKIFKKEGATSPVAGELFRDMYRKRLEYALVLLKDPAFLAVVEQQKQNAKHEFYAKYKPFMKELFDYLKDLYRIINRSPENKRADTIGGVYVESFNATPEDLQFFYAALCSFLSSGSQSLAEPYCQVASPASLVAGKEMIAAPTVPSPSVIASAAVTAVANATESNNLLVRSASVIKISAESALTPSTSSNNVAEVSKGQRSGSLSSTTSSSLDPSPTVGGRPLPIFTKPLQIDPTNGGTRSRSASTATPSPSSSPAPSPTASSATTLPPPLPDGFVVIADEKEAIDKIVHFFDPHHPDGYKMALAGRKAAFNKLFQPVKQHVKQHGVSIIVKLVEHSGFLALLQAPIHTDSSELKEIKFELKNIYEEAAAAHKAAKRNTPTSAPKQGKYLKADYSPTDEEICKLYNLLKAIKIPSISVPEGVLSGPRSRSPSNAAVDSSVAGIAGSDETKLRRSPPVGGLALPGIEAITKVGIFPSTTHPAVEEVKTASAAVKIETDKVAEQVKIINEQIPVLKNGNTADRAAAEKKIKTAEVAASVAIKKAKELLGTVASKLKIVNDILLPDPGVASFHIASYKSEASCTSKTAQDRVTVAEQALSDARVNMPVGLRSRDHQQRHLLAKAVMKM
jgi:hypothetical protein